MYYTLKSYPLFILTAILVVVTLCYVPGLSGAFLLDDYGSLPPLAQWGEINSLEKLSQFVSGGYTGPMGRPIPLLSFALNATEWPTDPKPFLVSNVIIHLINVALVFLLVMQIFKACNYSDGRVLWIASLVAVIWGLHPYLVSSVLYIVQRMTLLSATFSFLTFTLYLVGRNHFLNKRYTVGSVWWMGGAIASILGLLSKENAVLIPLQLLIIEVFLRQSGSASTNRIFSNGLLAALALVCMLIFYKLFAHVEHHVQALIWEGRSLATNREFTFPERLMTESRILGDYIFSILVPPIQTAGVFQDGYPVSRSFLNPLSTLVWFSIHCLLLTISMLVRKRIPVLFLGIMWFYCGHIVESSVVMLELKFEHRNYLPSIGLIFPIAVWVSALRVHEKWRWAISVLLVVILSILLFARSSLWGNPEQSSLVWVSENKRSQRALENAALVYSRRPEGYVTVSQLLAQAVKVSEGDPVLMVKYANYTCREFEVTGNTWGVISNKFISSSVNWQLYQVLSDTLDRVSQQKCKHINLEQFNGLIDSILENTKYKKTGTPKLMKELRARAALIFGENDTAIALFQAQALTAPLSMIMRQALWLASYNELNAASYILEVGILKSSNEDPYLLDQARDMKNRIDMERRKGSQ